MKGREMPLTDKDKYAWMTDDQIMKVMREFNGERYKNLTNFQLKIRWKAMSNPNRTRIVRGWDEKQSGKTSNLV